MQVRSTAVPTLFTTVCALCVTCSNATSRAPVAAPVVKHTPEVYQCDCELMDDTLTMRFENCLNEQEGSYAVKPDIIEKMTKASGRELLSLFSSCGVFYALENGHAMRTLLFDNSTDDFISGRARWMKGNRYGYMTRALEPVIAAQYEFAFPFRAEVGVVCNRCSFAPDNEHTLISCEQCGAVDPEGKVIYPLAYSQSDIFGLIGDVEKQPVSEPIQTPAQEDSLIQNLK